VNLLNSPDSVSREVILAGVAYVALLGFAVAPTTRVLATSLLPVPLIVLTVKNIRWAPVGMAALSALLMFVLGYTWFSPLFGLVMYFMGWSMGEALKSNRVPYQALAVGTLSVVMLELVGLAMARYMGLDFYATLKTILLEGVQQSSSVPQAAARNLISELVDRVRLLTPAILCVVGFLISVANVLGAKLILGPRSCATGLLTQYQLPQTVVTVYVIASVALLFPPGDSTPFWWQACVNVTYLGGFFIGIQGLSWCWRMVQSIRGKWLILVLLLILAPIPFVHSIYILAGLLDLMSRANRIR
jgi:Predicted membrane protein (DUF2232)